MVRPIAMFAAMLVLLAGNNPMQAFLGVAVVLLGLPVYLFLYRNKRWWKEGLRNDVD